ncbi:GNAT family N-acetyltransferase [Roseovarius sp.]|uniref:GNAT family N-acetyltransferase n=1 Tax=Roseovarius sp. TaxID=1486281 RepID=UPI002601F113|nr:GNAT family N-acetyltransferase [Roseovarius sp.]MDM8165004.1 GNAT family N-acetyltransferase [Roseovarius sp.]
MDTIAIRPITPGDADWIVARHGALYAQEAGFDDTFGKLVAEIVANFVASHDPAGEQGWVAEKDGRRLGCIFCVRLEEETAKLRLFLVEPEARGTGLGRRLLETCLGFAKDCGYRRLKLWTHESHRAACALYRARGFACESSVPVRSFGQDLVEQSWSIDLSDR